MFINSPKNAHAVELPHHVRAGSWTGVLPIRTELERPLVHSLLQVMWVFHDATVHHDPAEPLIREGENGPHRSRIGGRILLIPWEQVAIGKHGELQKLWGNLRMCPFPKDAVAFSIGP